MGNTFPVTKETPLNDILEAMGYTSEHEKLTVYLWLNQSRGIRITGIMGKRWSLNPEFMGYRIDLDYRLRQPYEAPVHRTIRIKNGTIDLDEFKAKIEAVSKVAQQRIDMNHADIEARKQFSQTVREVAAYWGLPEPDAGDVISFTVDNIRTQMRMNGTNRIQIVVDRLSNQQAKQVIDLIRTFAPTNSTERGS